MKLVKPVSSFLRNTFSELGGDAAQEMARSFDQQRRVACVKGKSFLGIPGPGKSALSSGFF